MSPNQERLPDIEELFLVSPSQPRQLLNSSLVGNNGFKAADGEANHDGLDRRSQDEAATDKAESDGNEASPDAVKVPGTELIWIRCKGEVSA